MNPSVTPTSPVQMQGSSGADLGAMLAGGALPVAVAVAAEHDLLAAIEARLAGEVADLINALNQFGCRAQAIGEELPLSSQFGKLVTQLLSSMSLQLAQALLKDADVPVLFDDGALYLKKLGLGLNDFLREVDLEGRRFLAVALIDKQPHQVPRGLQSGQPG